MSKTPSPWPASDMLERVTATHSRVIIDVQCN